MIKKIIIIIINILLSLWIMFSFNNSKTFLSILKETCYLWFSVLVPSILPMYFFSNLLLINERLFNVLYKLTSKLFHFENTTSCMLFFLSFITSNPTITILIKDAVDNNKISLFEGNRLMRCTNHFSIIFIKINSRNSYYFNLILFLQLFQHLFNNLLLTFVIGQLLAHKLLGYLQCKTANFGTELLF